MLTQRLTAALAVFLGFLVAGVAPATAEVMVLLQKDLVSGVLEGRRNSTFICDVVNKTDAPIDDITIKLKKPDGTQFGPTKWCDGVAPNASCQLSVPVVFPELDVAVYCHATTPKVFVRGSLRLQGTNNAALSESEMVTDIHGKLVILSEQIDMLDNSEVTIRAVQNCTFDNDQGAQNIASLGTFELLVDCPDDAQEYVLGCGCEVFDAGGSHDAFATHKDSVTDTAPVPSRCRCQWTNLGGSTQNVNFCAEAQCIGGDVTNVTP